MANWSTYPYGGLLSSITSTELRKIVFPVSCTHGWNLFSRGMEVWTVTDKLLCGLVDRLGMTGYHHTLEVELQFTETEIDFSEHDFTKFLPEFREKGVVTITDAVHGDLVLHSSTP